MKERKPYPFFYSVEFWTVIVKVLGTFSTALPLILKSGLSFESLFLFLGAIAMGCLLSAKELQIHQNLYTPVGIAGKDKDDAIKAIAIAQATELAKRTPQRFNEILQSTPIEELVDLAIPKPSMAKTGAKLLSKLFGK